MPVDGRYVVDLLPAMLLLGVGGGLAFPALMTLAMSSVRPEDSGLASGLVNTTQQVGGALGLAILASVAESRTGDATAAAALVDGYSAAFTVAAALVVAALVVARGRPAPRAPGAETSRPSRPSRTADAASRHAPRRARAASRHARRRVRRQGAIGCRLGPSRRAALTTGNLAFSPRSRGMKSAPGQFAGKEELRWGADGPSGLISARRRGSTAAASAGADLGTSVDLHNRGCESRRARARPTRRMRRGLKSHAAAADNSV